MKKYNFIYIVIGLFVFQILPAETDIKAKEWAIVQIAGKTFSVEVVRTEKDLIHGLSERESLAAGKGMLFIFEQTGRHNIWMKKMNFPIDILWINPFGKIIHIERNVHPDTYPKKFISAKLARYVLELNAFASKDIQLNTLIHIQKSQ